jgi:hypothetical protein
LGSVSAKAPKISQVAIRGKYWAAALRSRASRWSSSRARNVPPSGWRCCHHRGPVRPRLHLRRETTPRGNHSRRSSRRQCRAAHSPWPVRPGTRPAPNNRQPPVPRRYLTGQGARRPQTLRTDRFPAAPHQPTATRPHRPPPPRSASDPTTTVTAHPPPPTGGCDEPRSSRPTRGSTAPAGTPPSRRQVLPGPVTMAAATPIVEDAPRSGALVVERPSRGARWLPEWWPAGGASRAPPDRRTTRRSTCSVGRCSATARRRSSTRSSRSPQSPRGVAQVGLAWVLKNPVVTAPIVGATKPHHLADVVAARPQAHGKRNRRTREPLHPAHPDVFLTSQRRQCTGLPSPRDLEGDPPMPRVTKRGAHHDANSVAAADGADPRQRNLRSGDSADRET